MVAEAKRVVNQLVVWVNLSGQEEVVQRIAVVLVIEIEETAVYEHLEDELLTKKQHDTIVLQSL